MEGHQGDTSDVSSSPVEEVPFHGGPIIYRSTSVCIHVPVSAFYSKLK